MKHGKLDFHLTQVLSGHGFFKAYLHRMKKRNTAACTHCKQGEDDAEHTLFECPKWGEERRQTQEKMDIVLNMDIIVQTMLEREEQWGSVQSLANKMVLLGEKTPTLVLGFSE